MSALQSLLPPVKPHFPLPGVLSKSRGSREPNTVTPSSSHNVTPFLRNRPPTRNATLSPAVTRRTACPAGQASRALWMATVSRVDSSVGIPVVTVLVAITVAHVVAGSTGAVPIASHEAVGSTGPVAPSAAASVVIPAPAPPRPVEAPPPAPVTMSIPASLPPDGAARQQPA